MSKEFQDKIVHDVLILGPGGCGKSAFASAWAEKIVDGQQNHISRVLISENVSFDTFFGGYRPATIKLKEDGKEVEKITYQFIPGFFFKMYLEAKMNPDDNYVLIVEEINRGDSYNIFGDVFQLLDRKIEKNENGEINESEYGVSIPESAKGFIRNIMKEDSDKDRFYFGVNVQAEKIDELNNLYNEICNTNKIKMPNNMFIVATANTDIAGATRLDTAFLRRFSNVYMDLEGKVYGRPYDRHLLGFEKEEYNSDFTAENVTTENDEGIIKEKKYEEFRNYINGVILNDPDLSDDKLLSKHFVKMDKNVSNGVAVGYLHNEDFIINVLMYLRDNVFRDEDEFENKVQNKLESDLNELTRRIFGIR